MIRSRMMTVAVLMFVGSGVTAAVPAARFGPLVPLSLADTSKIPGSGCAFSFDTPPLGGTRRTMFYAIETMLMVRTRAGLSQCRIPTKAFDAFRDAKGPITCGGQRLSLRQTGQLLEPEEGTESDGSSYPATLTIGTGRGATTVRGDAGTAC